MFSASAADSHRFGRTRRNGYDPAEVDAVVARLVDDLRRHETKIETLESRLSEADASAEAIRKTFAVVEKTSEELLDEAKQKAAELIDEAREKAAHLVGEAEGRVDELLAEAERIRTEARSEAEATALLAERLEEEMAKARERTLSEMHDAAGAMRAEAETEAAERLVAAAAAADSIEAHSRLEAERIVEDANRHGERIIGDAEAEAKRLRSRVADLRSAVAELKGAATVIADVTQSEAAVIDLTNVERADARLSEPHGPESGPEDEVKTYYQRTTGIPLSERIKIARASQ